VRKSADDIPSMPGSLGNALFRLIRQKGLMNRSATDTLDAEWKLIVGPELARRSHARKIKDGIVEVAVTNSAVLEELRGYMHEEILQQLKTRLPDSEIRGVRYVRVR